MMFDSITQSFFCGLEPHEFSYDIIWLHRFFKDLHLGIDDQWCWDYRCFWLTRSCRSIWLLLLLLAFLLGPCLHSIYIFPTYLCWALNLLWHIVYGSMCYESHLDPLPFVHDYVSIGGSPTPSTYGGHLNQTLATASLKIARYFLQASSTLRKSS